MTVPCVCSVDPGAKGAIAFLTENGELIDVVDMPSVIVRVNRKDRTRVAEQALALLIAANRPLHAFVELSGPMPTDGSQQAYGMGLAAGLVERCIKAGTKPGDTVLDPFGGAGTTGLVSDRLGRSAVLIELNPAYVDLSSNRIADDAGLFAAVAAE